MAEPIGHRPLSRVGAVIPAYAPDDRLVELVRSALSQVDRLVVVDDTGPGSAPGTERVLDMCRTVGATVVRHQTNLGIGAALNTGIRTLGLDPETAFDFLLTLDQDSELPQSYVANLLQAYQSATQHGFNIGMLAPQVVAGVGTKSTRTSSGTWVGSEPIQSGLLVPTAALDQLGVFDDSLFIDSVDSDFYLRAKSAGLACVVAEGVGLGHSLGAQERVAVGPWSLQVRVAADFRYYYMVRNLVTMTRRHGRREKTWAIRAVSRLVRHLVLTTALVPQRRRRLSYACQGLRDGIKRVHGAMPQTGGAQVSAD